jgi:hypothetical protein
LVAGIAGSAAAGGLHLAQAGFVVAALVMPAAGKGPGDAVDAPMYVGSDLDVGAVPLVLARVQVAAVSPVEGGHKHRVGGAAGAGELVAAASLPVRRAWFSLSLSNSRKKPTVCPAACHRPCPSAWMPRNRAVACCSEY